MRQIIDRNRLFALFSALELDLRELIRAHLLDADVSEPELLGPSFEEVRQRYHKNIDTAVATGSDIFDYMYLADEVSVLHRFRDRLPKKVGTSIGAGKDRLDRLVPIRNRVMHMQPLLPDDAGTVQRWLGDLDAGGFAGDRLAATLRELRNNPDWSPTATFAAPAVPNNLPLSDHDDTGLLGRTRQVHEVRTLLLERRFPVVTLIGPGGMGKTALAIEVLHGLANDPACPYKAILWVSLKTERLTAAGVQDVRDAVKTLDQALPRLAEPLDGQFSGGIEDLTALLTGTDVLLAIDNLETIDGHEVVEFVCRLPRTVTCLFTTRRGLGRLEYPIEVDKLNLEAAVSMFQRLAAAYHVRHLEGLKQETLETVQDEVGRSPLHIKWFVQCAATGQDIETIRAHQTDLLQFCVQNVYQGLSPVAKDVAGVLAWVDRPPALADLKLWLPGAEPDELVKATRELLARSLCTRVLDEDQIIDRYLATDSLMKFLRLIGADNDDARKRVRRIEDGNRLAEERMRAEQARTPLDANTISGTDTRPGAAQGLVNALAMSRKRDVLGALRQLDEIEQLDPEFWELHRVRGFVLSLNGRVQAATQAFEQAINLAPDQVEAARVRYFFALHLIGRARDAHRGAEQARIAHAVLQRSESAFELGRALTYDRQFPEAVTALREALTSIDPFRQLIATTQLVDTLRRRAEIEGGELRSPQAAMETLGEAVDVGLSQGDRDNRLDYQLYRCVSDAVRFAARLPVGDGRDEGLRRVLRVVKVAPIVNTGLAGTYIVTGARRLLTAPDLPEDLALMLGELVDPTASAPSAIAIATELAGHIKVWKADRRFGFIAAAGVDYFFHGTDLDQPLDQIYLTRGLAVKFTPTVNNDRPRASDVRLQVQQDPPPLRRRRLTVVSADATGCYAVDDPSGVRLRVERQALADEDDWDTLAEGSRLIADIEVTPRGSYGVIDGSAGRH